MKAATFLLVLGGIYFATFVSCNDAVKNETSSSSKTDSIKQIDTLKVITDSVSVDTLKK